MVLNLMTASRLLAVHGLPKARGLTGSVQISSDKRVGATKKAAAFYTRSEQIARITRE
jgi:hypothetical protein